MPCTVAQTWELRPDPQRPLQQVKSGLFALQKYLWKIQGNELRVYHVTSLNLVSSWRFGAETSEGSSNVRVTCVVELRRRGAQLPLLLVALHCPIGAGLVCVFDCFASSVVRAVRVEHFITQMHVIDPGCTGCTLPPDSPLTYFDGVVALGTRGGDVLLLDLYKQACDNSIGDLDRTVKDETDPSAVTVVRKDKMADVKKYVARSVDRDQHVVVYLNDNPPEEERGEYFTLLGAEGEEIVHVDRGELEVSALYYAAQLGCVLVGYNFGAFQVWDLRNLELRYTSPICEDNIPIVDFVVQEPADDPKAYCYVWVAYSHAHLYQRGLPFAVLYSLYFERKSQMAGGGNLYEDFQHCSVRFQLELGGADAAHEPPKGGSFLRFQSITRDVTGLSLCQMSWRYWTAEREGATGVLVFDLNQWYKEQMPRVPNWNRCSNYMIKVGVDGLLFDVKMDEKSLVQFVGVQRLEEHFCPTALSFDLWGVSNDAILKLHNKGVQKEFLDAITTNQHLALLRPENLFEQITNLGLVPLFYDLRNSASLDQDAERELLFAVAIEHNLIEWLARAVAKMADDSFKSLDLRATDALRWALKRACAVKNALHAYCAPLFDWSGAVLDERTLALIAHGLNQIRHVISVYRHVTDKMAADADEYVAEQRSLENLVVYFETLLWMTNVGLLPERSATYPVDELTNYYHKRRAHLHQLSTDVTYGERDSLLFIDNLINRMEGADELRQQWQEDGGAGVYPPPSLQSVLRVYLLDTPPLRHKHWLVGYALLDLAHLTPHDERAVARLLKFPQRFDWSQSDTKIAHAFWCLDHERHDAAVDAILDASVRDDALSAWQHRVALTSLLAHARADLALRYVRARPAHCDLARHVTLLIARDLIDAAFAARQRRAGRGDVAALTRIFGECARGSRLRALLHRRLNAHEESALFRYLEERAEGEDLRVVYCLMRARFLEAFDLAAQRTTQASNQQQGVTESVLKLFKQLLPDVNRALVELVRSERANCWRERPRPAPFSVYAHDARARVRYKSSAQLAALSKANATFATKPSKMATETTPFLRTPTAFRARPEKATPLLRTKVIEQNEEEEEEGPTPRKRIKLSPRGSVKSAVTTTPGRHLLLSADAKSTLGTPIVRRKRPDDATPGVATPPASILKARHVTGDAATREECENSSFPPVEVLRTPLKARVKFDVSRQSGGSLDATTPTTGSEPSRSSESTKMTVDVPVFEDSVSDDVISQPAVKYDSPRARRSYKRPYTESASPVRSSPRLSASTTTASTSVDTPPTRARASVHHVTVTEETRYSFTLSEISESDISGVVTTSAEASLLEADDDSARLVRARPSIGAFAKTRKSLTRAVLEQNAFALLPPPSLIVDPATPTEKLSESIKDGCEPEREEEKMEESDGHVTGYVATDDVTGGCAVYDDLSSASDDAQVVMERLRDETSAEQSTRDHARFLDSIDGASVQASGNDQPERHLDAAEVIEIDSSSNEDDNVSNRNGSSSGTELPELEVNVIEEASTSEEGEPVETRSISVQCTPERATTPDQPLRLRTVKKTYARRETPKRDSTPEESTARNVAVAAETAQSPEVLRLRSVRKTYGVRKPSTDDVTASGRVTRRRSLSVDQSLQGEREKKASRRILRDSELGGALLAGGGAEEGAERRDKRTPPRTSRKKTTEPDVEVHVTVEPSKRRRSQSVDHTITAAAVGQARSNRSKSVDVGSDPVGDEIKRKSGSKKVSKPLSEMGDYATSRRLTRRQASMLSAINPDRKLPIVDELDPIELLDKTEFRGTKDADELTSLSPSTSSEASPKRTRSKGRGARSATPTVASGIKARLRRTSTEAASGRSETTPSPPKRAKTRARSVSSTKSSSSQKRSTRSRKPTDELAAVAEEGDDCANAKKN